MGFFYLKVFLINFIIFKIIIFKAEIRKGAYDKYHCLACSVTVEEALTADAEKIPQTTTLPPPNGLLTLWTHFSNFLNIYNIIKIKLTQGGCMHDTGC